MSICYIIMTVSWLRRLAAGRRLGFASGLIHVRFVVSNVAWDRFFSKFFGAPVNIIPPCLYIIFIIREINDIPVCKSNSYTCQKNPLHRCISCEISGSSGGEYDDNSILGYRAVNSPPWWWRQYATAKHRSTSTTVHGAISQKVVIFIVLLRRK
jgi:hypothetical protein